MGVRVVDIDIDKTSPHYSTGTPYAQQALPDRTWVAGTGAGNSPDADVPRSDTPGWRHHGFPPPPPAW